MANRTFECHRYSLEKGVVELFGQYTIGAAAGYAATAVAGHAKGLTSLAYSATGVYTLTLDDSYVALLDFSAKLLRAAVDTVGLQMQLISEAVATSGTRTIVFNFVKPTNSSTTTMIACVPVQSDKIFLHVTLSNSTAV